jgi:hypothetical protein
MYPIAKLIAGEMLRLGITKRELVIRMGYKNIYNGLSNLHNFLYRYYYNPEYLKNILRVINIDGQTLNLAKESTEKIIELEKDLQLEKEKRLNVVREMRWEINHLPYLHRKTEPPTPYRMNLSYFIFYSEYKFKFLNKSLLGLTDTEQLERVSHIIKKDYHLNIGRDDYYERIISYVFHKDIDTKIEFDINGILINQLK